MAKSDSTRKPKPPKVWIKFPSCELLFHPEKGANVYAPLQKPRRCVWTIQDGNFMSSHGMTIAYGMFCHDCGGKIKVKS